jgi:DHA1 family multidrug resistance protein-like MFS transporter
MRNWKFSFAALVIAEFIFNLAFAISTPIIPLFIEKDLRVMDYQKLNLWVGLAQSVPYISLALTAPIWGRLSDRYSKRLMLLRCMIGGAAVVMVITFIHTPLQLVVLRGIEGCFTGSVTAAIILTTEIVPVGQMAFAMGLIQTGVAVGGSLGPLLGGIISDFFGYRITFVITSLVSILAALIIIKFVKEEKKPVPFVQPGDEKTGYLRELRAILRSSVLAVLLALNFAYYFVNYSITSILALFVRELLTSKSGATPSFVGSSTGFVLGLSAGATAVAAAIAGKTAGSLGYRKTLIWCLAAGTVLTIPQIFAADVIQLAILRMGASFFLGGTVPVLNAMLLMESGIGKQGSVFGINAAVGYLGAAAGPLAASLAAFISYRFVFVVTAILLGISTLGAIKGTKR